MISFQVMALIVVFDWQLLRMIREEILPHSGALPKDFMARVMALLNRGSIHSAADATFSGMCHMMYF